MMKNYKSVLYGAVAYSVIIGLIYVALSLLGLLARWGVIDAVGSPLIYMLYLIYFRVGGAIQWDLLGAVSGVNAIMPEETAVVARTFIIFLIYLALHTFLILISLYALCGVNNSCLGSSSCGIFFVPWIIVWIAIITLDLTATTYFTIDTVNTQNVDGLMEILEIENTNTVGPVFEEQVAWQVKIFPSIIMLLTASKLIFFLFCNIVWVVAIARAGKAASTYHKYVDNSRRTYQSNMGNQNPAFDNFEAKNGDHRPSVSHELPISESPENAETRYNDTTRVQTFAYVRNAQSNDRRPQSPTIVEEDINYRIQRPATASATQQEQRPMSIHVQHYEKTTYRADNVDPEIENRLSRYQESNGVVIRTVEPLKNDDIPDHQKSIIGVRVLPPVARSMSENKSKPVPPPKPNNRYSMQPMMETEEPVLYKAQDRPTNPPKLDRNNSSMKPVPAELRNQFAFNYLVDPNGQNQVPKRTFKNLSEDEESPAVPVPDYTLHFPPSSRKRTNWSNSDDDYSGQWSQQNQQRY